MTAIQRVAILHQGFIPRYRERFYADLNSGSDTQYVVFHGQAPEHTGHTAAPGPFPFPNVFRRNIELRIGSRTILYQPVIWSVLTGGFDAAVVGHEFKMLANLMVLAAFKLMRRPALLWGHGFHRETAHWLARAASGLLARVADGYLVYTESGAARLREAGVPAGRIHVIRNTIDLNEQIQAHGDCAASDIGELRRELGLRPEVATLLYIGRLYERKRTRDLIELARRLNRDRNASPFDLAIVGDGPDASALREAAADLPNVHFFGAVFDVDSIARFMRISVAMVNPGSVGLAVNQCFAHGVPVITRVGRLHSPEFDYIRDGENGLVVDGDFDAFVAAVRRILCDPALRRQLAKGALATRDSLGLDSMVIAFRAGIAAAFDATVEEAQDDDRPDEESDAPFAVSKPK